jgi:hypothetical protein
VRSWYLLLSRPSVKSLEHDKQDAGLAIRSAKARFRMNVENANKRRGTARPGFVRGSWREKVNSVFAAWCYLQKKGREPGRVRDVEESDRKFKDWLKQAATLSRAMNEARRTVKTSVGIKLLDEILRGLKFHDLSDPEAASDEERSTMPVNPESSPFFWQLVFMKHGITFRELICQMEIHKRPAAHRKLMAVHRDYWKLITKGPADLKLTFKWDHFSLIIQGLDFGLDQLTPDELADCLDEICPCGLRHFPGYIKKVRTRIKQACDRYSK